MSLAIRVALAIAALTIMTAVLVTGSAIVSTSAGVRADVDNFLRERAQEIADGTRAQPDRRDNGRGDGDAVPVAEVDLDDAEDLAEAVDTNEVIAATDVDAEAQSIDEDGDVIASTGLAIPVTARAIETASGDAPGFFDRVVIDDVEYRIFTGPIPDGGAIQVATSLEATTSLLSLLRTRLLLIGGGLAILAAAVGWWIARRSLRPLGELTATAEHVARTQDLDTPIPVERDNDEIGRLAASFNEMLDALANSKEQQHRLVQDAAHELRTPLTSVNANIDLLMHARDLPVDERQEILGRVRGELRQLGSLFTEVIELATDKREMTEHRELNLVAVVEKAVDDLARRSDNPVTIDASASMVVGDFKALHRAVTNLLGNAVKYSPVDSPIHVSVSNGRVAVQDRGPGIPAADRERVFDRFHRLDEARQLPGSGLGLAIVAKIVADHGGSTFIDDAEPAPGVVVGFSIPPAAQ